MGLIKGLLGKEEDLTISCPPPCFIPLFSRTSTCSPSCPLTLLSVCPSVLPLTCPHVRWPTRPQCPICPSVYPSTRPPTYSSSCLSMPCVPVPSDHPSFMNSFISSMDPSFTSPSPILLVSHHLHTHPLLHLPVCSPILPYIDLSIYPCLSTLPADLTCPSIHPLFLPFR